MENKAFFKFHINVAKQVPNMYLWKSKNSFAKLNLESKFLEEK